MFYFFLLFLILFFIPYFIFYFFFMNQMKKLLFISLYFNMNNIFIVVCVLMISFFIFFFSFYYLKSTSSFYYFLIMLSIFIFSMILLCFSNSIIIFFLGWDGLGVSSFILIMYYMNWKSMNNSVFTIMSNRIGDGLILIFFGIFFWDFFSNIFFLSGLLLIIISMTKSAQFPFSAWLPAAMAAPTPVSALVHSSTLVTAGVVILMKNFFYLKMNQYLNIIFLIGLITVFMAGFCSMSEMDFKKLVAISTLSQMGLLFLILGAGSKWLCLFHLISHAFFKSCLFITVGYVLHFFFSKQDWRSFNMLFFLNKSQSVIIFVCVMSLCGLFFTSGLISKDFFLDFFTMKKMKMIIIFVFYLSLFFTFFYSFRLYFCVMKISKFSLKTGYMKTTIFMFFSNSFVFFLTIFFSYWMMMNYFYFFSSLSTEKKSLFSLFVFFFICFFLYLFFSLLMKKMFFMDLIFKSVFFEKSKQNTFFEKNIVDFYNIFMVVKILTNKLFFLSKMKKMFYLLFIISFIFFYF